MLLMFFYLITYVFLSRSLLSHHIPKRQRKTNPKSKLQNPDQKARLPWGKRKSFVPKGLPLILMEKIGLFAPCFFHVFFLSSKLRCFSFLGNVFFPHSSVILILFLSFDSFLLSFVYSVCFFSISSFFLCCPLLSHYIPKRKKKQSTIQTPKSRSKSAKLRPERHKHLNPLLPLILIKKLGCLPHVFFIFFPVIKAALFFLCGSLGLPSHRKTLKEKIARVPPRGPFPLW